MEKKEIYICQQQQSFEEEEIDLKELLKTIWRYKSFILGFTFVMTLVAGIYVFLKKPVYQIESFIELGSYSTNTQKTYFIDPNSALILIQNEFILKNKLPDLESISFKKRTTILDLKINGDTNLQAKDYLNKIIQYLQDKENKKIELFVNNINSKILNLENYKKALENRIKILDAKISPNLDPSIYQAILNNINDLNNKIFDVTNQIIDLKTQISPLNITKTHIIGKIVEHDSPIKPKKKLILVVTFITSFILSIFLVFFIEFIKSLKEEEK